MSEGDNLVDQDLAKYTGVNFIFFYGLNPSSITPLQENWIQNIEQRRITEHEGHFQDFDLILKDTVDFWSLTF